MRLRDSRCSPLARSVSFSVRLPAFELWMQAVVDSRLVVTPIGRSPTEFGRLAFQASTHRKTVPSQAVIWIGRRTGLALIPG